MRQMRQMLRLDAEGVSVRAIGRTVGAARSTVQDALRRAAKAGLAWPLPDDLTDAVLERRLFAHSGSKTGRRRHAEPDWATLVREQKRPGMSLQILWEEYRTAHPTGYGYSRFCDLFREFERRLTPTMRQHHVAGEKAFVDYSGKRVPIIDARNGQVREAELFVGVLGASNLTYAELTWTQQLPDWIGAHVRLFDFFGGTPRLLVPDNLKSAVHKASFYDPEVNRSYGAMMEYYGVGVLPARPYRPRDKAKVEAAVRLAQSYILGRLRKQTHFSLVEANAAVQQAVLRINDAIMRRLGVSRRQLFETIEKPLLRALPSLPYQFAEWRLARVGLDYHVEADGVFYSVPHGLIGRQVEVRIAERTIEVFAVGQRVAAHERHRRGAAHSTDVAHMPARHRYGSFGSADRHRATARAIGPFSERLIDSILVARRHPEQGLRTCLGVLRRMRDLPIEQVEAAAERALAIGTTSYRNIVALLDRQRPGAAGESDTPPLIHANVRGSRYFH